MRIVLHIDRLILQGVPLAGGAGSSLQAAVELELAERLIHGGVRRELKGATVPSIQIAKVVDATPQRPRELGQALARAVYSGIGENTPRSGANEVSRRARGARI